MALVLLAICKMEVPRGRARQILLKTLVTSRWVKGLPGGCSSLLGTLERRQGVGKQ